MDEGKLLIEHDPVVEAYKNRCFASGSPGIFTQ